MITSSTKPYLIRAIYEWCNDFKFTSYIVVLVDEDTIVPTEFVNDGEIILNISQDAINNLKIDNNFVSFSARFGGTSRKLDIPVKNIKAIYAKENGQGMVFEVEKDQTRFEENVKNKLVDLKSKNLNMDLVKTHGHQEKSENTTNNKLKQKKTRRKTKLTLIK